MTGADTACWRAAAAAVSQPLHWLNVPVSERSAAPVVPGLIEPLTGRELQVLAMLAAAHRTRP